MPEQFTRTGTKFTYEVPNNIIVDEEGEVLTYTAAGDPVLPSWITFDPNTRIFTGTPGDFDIGRETIQLVGTDPHGGKAESPLVIDIEQNFIPQI
jgi:hypothetical protein